MQGETMSFDLTFWYEDDRSTPEEAFRIYDQLTDGETGVVAASAAIDEFLADVVSVYQDLTEENMEESPWAAPLYRTPECVIANIAWSRHKEVNDVLIDLANKHGLTTYNPQDRLVVHPIGA
jgi:hypothetical protein